MNRDAYDARLLGAIAEELLHAGSMPWETRALAARDALHEAGYHRPDTDDAGHLTTSPRSECDVCAPLPIPQGGPA